MNTSKVEEDLFHHHLDPLQISEAQPLISDHHHHEDPPPFSLPPMSEFVLFRDEDDEEDSVSHTSSDAEAVPPASSCGGDPNSAEKINKNPRGPFQTHPAYINPESHISSQFYTFNSESHALMIRCILEGRLATPDEIRSATPSSVLSSWRSVWKDRNEDTAYLTAWKRIQDKLNVHVGEHDLDMLLDVMVGDLTERAIPRGA